MSAASEDLRPITRGTLAHYDRQADEYERRTRDHDVRQNVAALLRNIEGPRPWTILDFGCGPGRDLATFAAMGHEAIGLDGSIELVRLARAATGLEVWHQDFVALDLPPARFDGVYANASMLHVPNAILPTVLAQLHATLKPRGVFFASIPHGDDEEGWSGARYCVFHRPATWQRYLVEAGFTELESFFRPAGVPREEQRWFASAWRRAPGADIDA